ncbi:MAG: putative surface protein with fasciclin (FAS1) repeats [Planctomycetota bacterium]|jgi:uncharacterized surface protein with fasciclin (FAS1) repeats
MKKTTISFGLVTLLVASSCSSSSSSKPSLAAAVQNQNLTTLAAALDAADLTETLQAAGEFTLLAPSEAAFAALPAGTLDFLLDPANKQSLVDILTYHVIPVEADSTVVATLDTAPTLFGDELLIDQIGQELFANDARVIIADVAANNGFLHVIDRVLLPPTDIVSTLQSKGFDTLVAAVTAANLGATLSGPGPFTVLAPTDAAFDLLPAGTLDTLLLPANLADLTDILTYHVLGQELKASEVVVAETQAGLNGVTLLFAAEADPSAGIPARVNGISISTVNIPCTNGVIHVIDAVLLPPGDIPTLATEAGLSTLVAALVAAELDDDLAAAGPFTVFAPSNAAFAALPVGVLDDLLLPANQAQLIDILLYHVVADELTAAEVLASTTLTTLQGSEVAVVAADPSVGGAGFVQTNALARNGIVHVIDAVLLPPAMLMSVQNALPKATLNERQANSVFGSEVADFLEFGYEDLPFWYGVPGSRSAGWSSLDGSAANPVFADVRGSDKIALFIETPGTRVSAEGSLLSALDASLRMPLVGESVPKEVALQLRLQGEVPAISLRYAKADGEVMVFKPSTLVRLESSVDGTYELSARWTALDEGLSVRGVEILVEGPSGSLEVERARVLALD